MEIRIALLGCGNVGHALLDMLVDKERVLREEYDLTVRISGGMTRRGGSWSVAPGITAADLLASGWPGGARPNESQPFTHDAVTFARECPADVLVELTTLNPATGLPALDHVRAALRGGRDVVTANKGPIAHGYHELRELAHTQNAMLRFESTVMDGTPIFSLAESALPATKVIQLRGVLNSTSNYILSRMGAGETVEQALAGAQALGIAEANPSNDLEGWDAAVKTAVLVTVLMRRPLRPADVIRDGLGVDTMRRAIAAAPTGHVVKQVATASTRGDAVVASVRLETLAPGDHFASLSGMEAALMLTTDTMGELAIIEGEGGPGQTAFGVLADIIAIAQARRAAVQSTPPPVSAV